MFFFDRSSRIDSSILPESPRWLISQQRYDDAEILFQHIAEKNKKTFDRETYKQFVNEDKKVGRGRSVEMKTSFDCREPQRVMITDACFQQSFARRSWPSSRLTCPINGNFSLSFTGCRISFVVKVRSKYGVLRNLAKHRCMAEEPLSLLWYRCFCGDCGVHGRSSHP